MAYTKHVRMHDAVNWHASQFYPDEEQIVVDLLASGKDFIVEGNAKKCDIYVEIKAIAETILCCVTVGTDNKEHMVDDAMKEVCALRIDELSDKQTDKIFNSMQQRGVITEVMSTLTISRNSTLEKVELILDELEERAYKELDQYLKPTIAIVREVLGLEKYTSSYNSIN